jgi:hypothetical protein
MFKSSLKEKIENLLFEIKSQETFLFRIYSKCNYVKQGRNNFKMIKVINIRQKDYVVLINIKHNQLAPERSI